MIVTDRLGAGQGRVRLLLLVWTLVVAGVAAYVLGRKGGSAREGEPPAATFEVQVDPAHWEYLTVMARIAPSPGRLRLAGAPGAEALRVEGSDGGARRWRRAAAGWEVEAKPGEELTVTYRVRPARRRGPYHEGIATPLGAALRLADLLLVPAGAAGPLRLHICAPAAVQVFLPRGLKRDGTLEPVALRTGALAWAATDYESLLSPPHRVRVFFLGRPGVGDPLVLSLRRLARWLVRDLCGPGEHLAHDVVVVDLPAPYHRVSLLPQGNWQVVERGPPVFHRVRRVAAGILAPLLPQRSATPPGRDGRWYPAALKAYGPYLAAEEAGVRAPLSWRPPRRLLEEAYLRRVQAGDPLADAYRGAVALAELALTHGNARSLRLLSLPARSPSRLPFRQALAAELYLEDLSWFDRILRGKIYLPADSPWRAPVLYERPRPSPPLEGRPDLRLLVLSETYADPAGCPGCPRAVPMARWVRYIADRTGAGGWVACQAGDWVPFFLEEDLDAERRAARVRLAAMAAERAGLAALVVGPGEVGWGVSFLRALPRAVRTPLLSANVEERGRRLFSPFRLVRCGGYTVALVGITDFPRRRYRLSWFAEALTGVTVAEPVKTACAAAAEARRAGADLVVLVGALDPLHARLLAAAPGDVDLIVSSAPGFDRPPHAGRGTFTAHDRSGFVGRIPVIYVTGGRGALQEVAVRLRKEKGRLRVAAFQSRAVQVSGATPPDPVVAAQAAEYRRRYGERP